eukprot:673474-Prymnesium_polylepis.2
MLMGAEVRDGVGGVARNVMDVGGDDAEGRQRGRAIDQPSCVLQWNDQHPCTDHRLNSFSPKVRAAAALCDVWSQFVGRVVDAGRPARHTEM